MPTEKVPPENARTWVRFEPAFDDQEPFVKGPYRFVHIVHRTLLVGADGGEELAHNTGGWWVTLDGRKWEDVTIWGE